MADANALDFETIADQAHEAIVGDDAIKKTVAAARKAIVKAKLPYSLSVSRREVFKKPLPA